MPRPRITPASFVVVVFAVVPFAALTIPGATSPAAAQANAEPSPRTPDSLAAVVQENRYPVTGERGALSGPGLAFLLEEARESEFVLLGESHLVREIPLLTRRLLSELRPDGYRVFAVETGPLTARWMAERIEEEGLSGYVAAVRRFPFTVPFYEQREEAELLEGALGRGYEIWGLDQEFVGSGRLWLSRLADLAPDDEARRLVERWREAEARAVERFVETERTDQVLYHARTSREFAELRAAFAGVEEGRAIVEAMATSARIYQLWRRDNYENNRQRIAYMKENLVRRLRVAKEEGGPPPKILFKFGSFHMGRGLSPANQYDLGTLAQELAVLRGGRSLHVQATAVGMRREDGSFDRWLEADSEWAPLLAQMTDGPWTLFDLRPLRRWFHRSRNRAENPDLADKVYQYDVVLVAREFTPSEALAELPGR